MKKEKSCGAIIFKSINGRLNVLLIQQIGGHWGFPKGHVEDHETEHQTAIREVKEETNIEIKIVGDFRETNSYSPIRDIYKDVIYFIGIPTNNEIKTQASEISEATWYPIEEALEKVTFPNDIAILRLAIEYFQKM
ncbi:bis(5'-nucleosyl)-tetraphosphatase [Mycoplasma phocoeninasale]|uniref:bis(5'-nucleosyl)-tetraphosphatase n=1 Tax=Mycoplasma phocoeninasale TaxID=2726117 RepID=UPI001967D0AD|nr:NUDIX domain-containing protein [Mycoplasma phocoeninasale]MBN0970883.1 NUDIX domain-containing protein [Mycoplasma phocoeninasale]